MQHNAGRCPDGIIRLIDKNLQLYNRRVMIQENND